MSENKPSASSGGVPLVYERLVDASTTLDRVPSSEVASAVGASGGAAPREGEQGESGPIEQEETIRAVLTNEVIRAVCALRQQRQVCREQAGQVTFVSGMDAAREYLVEQFADALAASRPPDPAVPAESCGHYISELPCVRPKGHTGNCSGYSCDEDVLPASRPSGVSAEGARDFWQTIYDAAANEGTILHDDTVTAINVAVGIVLASSSGVSEAGSQVAESGSQGEGVHGDSALVPLPGSAASDRASAERMLNAVRQRALEVIASSNPKDYVRFVKELLEQIDAPARPRRAGRRPAREGEEYVRRKTGLRTLEIRHGCA